MFRPISLLFAGCVLAQAAAAQTTTPQAEKPAPATNPVQLPPQANSVPQANPAAVPTQTPKPIPPRDPRLTPPRIQDTTVPPAVGIPAPPQTSPDAPLRPLTADDAARIALRLQPNISIARGGIETQRGRTRQIKSALNPQVTVTTGYTFVQNLTRAGRGGIVGGSGTGTGTGVGTGTGTGTGTTGSGSGTTGGTTGGGTGTATSGNGGPGGTTSGGSTGTTGTSGASGTGSTGTGTTGGTTGGGTTTTGGTTGGTGTSGGSGSAGIGSGGTTSSGSGGTTSGAGGTNTGTTGGTTGTGSGTNGTGGAGTTGTGTNTGATGTTTGTTQMGSGGSGQTTPGATTPGQTGTGVTTTGSGTSGGGNVSGIFQGFSSQATLRQLIFDFNHTLDLARQSSQLEKAATQNLSRVQSDTVLEVKQAFYLLVQNQQQVQVQELEVGNRQAQLDLAQARFNVGLGLPIDIVNAQTAKAEAILSLSQAQANAETARINLTLLMGLDPRTPLQPAESGEPPVTGTSINDLAATALRQRPEVLQAQATVRAYQYGVSAARSVNSPAVTANASVFSRGDQFLPQETDLTVGIGLTWTPVDGGVRRGQVQEARGNVSIAQGQLNAAQLNVTSDVATAYVNLRAAETRVNIALASAANAEEGVRIATGRYATGLGLFLDIINAQAFLLTARTNVVNTQNAVEQYRVALQHAIGATVPPLR